MDTESVLTTIAAMRRQEDTNYVKGDYFQLPNVQYDVDPDCRTKMAGWCYQIVDFCEFSREAVELAMNLLDRYLRTEQGRHVLEDRTVFQLASMTALYTAVKISEPEAMDPKTVSNLSKGCYSADEIVAMELNMLQALQWRVNPPNALSFVRYIVELLNDVLNKQTKDAIFEMARFQTELAVSNYDFINVNDSTIAFCAVINALTAQFDDAKFLHQAGCTLVRALDLVSDDVLDDIRRHLLHSAQAHDPHRVVMKALDNSTETKETRNDANTVTSRSSVVDVSPRSTLVSGAR